ncbi:MAG: phosphoglycerate dehydrogenase [Lachnospiraceae bacterium]|jgi:D-3-phosphoglycerate dehydrogenase|nr:phosphoglycerate dehydrogenase [Lachnospiraceae bacterium]
MKKIHCLNPISPLGTDLFTADYEMTGTMEGAEGILVRSAAMHDLALPDSLLAVARAGAGVNNIPLEECAKKGIVVFNTPGANANGVKELVICGMLLASRDVVGGIEWLQSIKDDPAIAKTVEKGKKSFAGTEIKGKTLGIVGLGAIGTEVANAALALGMEVYGYDPYLSVNAAWMLSRSVRHINTLEQLYRASDYISLHLPLTDATKGMVGEEALGMMKDGVVILNFARDLLVDDAAMAGALHRGKVRRYVTDFPNPASSHMEGAIVIPHLGASTEESEDNCAVMAVRQLMDYLENGNILNSVNYPNCDLGHCRDGSRIAIFHLNIPNIIGQFAGAVASGGINISDMTDKSREQYAYAILDLEKPAGEEILAKLRAIDGVLRVRVVK